MKLTVISPEAEDPREAAALAGFAAAGLDRYHVRKPAWEEGRTLAWLEGLPAALRPRLVLHGHPALAARLGLDYHARDKGDETPRAYARSCHDLPALERRLPKYAALFFGPVFMSLSKGGYGPAADFPWTELQRLLTGRAPGATAEVYAVGGVTSAGLARCQSLGFDGVAVMGAVWGEADPVAAFRGLQQAAATLEAKRHAA